MVVHYGIEPLGENRHSLREEATPCGNILSLSVPGITITSVAIFPAFSGFPDIFISPV